MPSRRLVWSSVGIFLLQVVLLVPLSRVYLSLQDEGNILAYASRIIAGQAPWQDFFLRFMPGTPYLLSLAFRIFGEHILVARLYFLVSMGLLAVVIWWVSYRLMPEPWHYLPVVMFFCVGGHFWPMLSYHWDASITALMALLLAERQEDRALVAAGAFGGLTVLLLQPRGIAVCLALAAVALCRGPRLRRLGLTVAGAAIPGLLFVGWLLISGLFQGFWQQFGRFREAAEQIGCHHQLVGTQVLAQIGGVPHLERNPFGMHLWLELIA